MRPEQEPLGSAEQLLFGSGRRYGSRHVHYDPDQERTVTLDNEAIIELIARAKEIALTDPEQRAPLRALARHLSASEVVDTISLGADEMWPPVTIKLDQAAILLAEQLLTDWTEEITARCNEDSERLAAELDAWLEPLRQARTYWS